MLPVSQIIESDAVPPDCSCTRAWSNTLRTKRFLILVLPNPCEQIFCPPALFWSDRFTAPLQCSRIIFNESFFEVLHDFISIANIRRLRGEPSGAICAESNIATPIHFRVRSRCRTIISCSATYSPCAPSGRLIAIRL